jgi:hypothetical protein
MVKETTSLDFKFSANSLAGTSALFNNMNLETGNKMTVQFKALTNVLDFEQALLTDRDPLNFASVYMNEYNTVSHRYDYTMFLNSTLFLSPNAMANLLH